MMRIGREAYVRILDNLQARRSNVKNTPVARGVTMSPGIPVI